MSIQKILLHGKFKFFLSFIEQMVYIYEMKQTISKQFHAALTYLLAKEGRGAQSRLAQEHNIDRGYMNAIVKGRKAGAEELRTRIAAHFQMTYEEMLALGRTILDGDNVLLPGENDGEEQDIPEESRPSISVELLKIFAILESDSRYSDALSSLADAFYEAGSLRKDNLALQERIKEMESRIADLERLAAKKKTAGKSA